MVPNNRVEIVCETCGTTRILPPEPVDAFGAHVTDGVIGYIGGREIGPGHVVLSEERYRWLRRRAGLEPTP